jgi:hypothetical protein
MIKHQPLFERLVVVVSLVVRGLMLQRFLSIRPDLFTWNNNEYGFAARSILIRHVFAIELYRTASPTAFMPPLYATLLSGVFSALGIQTFESAVAAVVINITLAGLTTVVILKIGKHILGWQSAILGALLWAMSPIASLPCFLVWESCLTTLLLSLAVLSTFLLDKGMKSWVMCGVWRGLAGLCSPSVLAPIPAIGVYLTTKCKKERWRPLIIAVVAALVLLPWTLRGTILFHRFVPIRDNGLAEVYFGQVGYLEHPLGQTMEYQRMGEEKYLDMIEVKLASYIERSPGLFLERCARKVSQFWTVPNQPFGMAFVLTVGAWTGLVILYEHNSAAAIPLGALMIFYPLVYYMSVPFSRYRLPIEPFMDLLTAYALHQLMKGRRQGTLLPL